MSEKWFLEEASLAGREHLDAAYVLGYDREAAFEAAGEVALLRGLGLDEDSTLVDPGAGTGTLALAAPPNCRRVVAVDVSPAMVAVLRESSTQTTSARESVSSPRSPPSRRRGRSSRRTRSGGTRG